MKRHANDRNKDLLLDNVFRVPKFLLRNRKAIAAPEKIVILKFSGIGDAILSLPMIKSLKAKTGADISVACSTENEIIFREQPFIDNLYSFNIKDDGARGFFKFFLEMRKKKFDVSIDTSQSSFISSFMSRYISKHSIGFRNWATKSRNNFFDYLVELNPKRHMVKCYYDLVKDFDVDMHLKLMPPAVKKETDLIKRKKLKNIVGIHASSPFEYRNWPKKNYAELIDFLLENGKSVLLFGAPDEKEDNEKILSLVTSKKVSNVVNGCGQISLKEMFAILPKLDFFVANDGGPMHMAASFDIPVIGIFGSDTPFRYAPFNAKSYSLYKPFKNGPINKAYALEWPNEENVEIPDKITVDDMIETIGKIK